MNRLLLSSVALLSALLPLILDSALKGAALLAVAALSTLALVKASAATRHLVWLVAVVALLVVPVLSVGLPEWRILPTWRKARTEPVSAEPIKTVAANPIGESNPSPVLPSIDPTPASLPIVEVPPPPVAAPSAAVALPVPPAPLPEFDWLPLAWLAGFVLLVLRLATAHLHLRRSARRCLKPAADHPITALAASTCSELGIRQRVTLLLDCKRSIPAVWGVLRPQLLLPSEAEEWSAGKIRSVLLHELAHLKRRDPLVQWLTQIACAFHWWNPLVWLAAWRIHVERERACDDLVLGSGVRPSAYAEHLLDVATKLSPARWTQGCGLAMARKSSLEGRLTAVLSETRNRRGITRVFIAAAIFLSVAIAVPVAMLKAAPPDQASRNVELQPETIAKLKWGEPVDGLRMALAWPPALNDALLGDKPVFQLVVQNVSEKEVHFVANEEAPNPRRLLIREGERIVQGLSDPEVSAAEWKLQPGQCGVLPLYTREAAGEGGVIPSAAIESDLSKLGLYHAIVQMEIANAPAGAWTGKLVTGETRGSADKADAPAPKHKDARALYDAWQRHARSNGDIPGALIGELAIGMRRFIHYNPTWETVPKLNEILARLDTTRDWQPADAIALLDEVAAVQDSPIGMALSDENDRVIAPGQPLPKELADKPWIWSQADTSGLRIGWELEPRGQPALMTSKEENWISSHAVGTALGARLFVHNTGDKPVVVRVPTWHQGGVTAVNKDDAKIEVSGIEWMTRARLVTHRLAPGEYVAIRAPGVGFGKDAGRGPWVGPRIGWHVMAQPGDWVRLTHAPLKCDASHVGRREVDPIEDGPAWWTEFVKARLARGLTGTAEKSDAITLPAPADRARLLDSACLDLFGTGPTAAERTAFDAVNSRATLFSFAEKLARRPGITSFDGTLTPRHAWFEIHKPDPAADKTPRVVLGPGEYPLSPGTAAYGAVTLKIVGRPVADRSTNDAQLLFEAIEFTGALAPEPHKLELPDGWGTWAIVCRPGEGFFYLLHEGSARKIDYTKPREVTNTPATDLPAEFRDEVKRQLDLHEISAEPQAGILGSVAAPADSAPAAAAQPSNGLVPRAAGEWSPEWQALSQLVAESRGMAEWKPDDVIAWGPEKDGLRSGMLIPRSARLSETVQTMLVVRNVSGATKELKVCTSLNVLTPSVRSADDRTAVEVRKVSQRGADALHSVTLKAGEQLQFAGPPVLFGIGTGIDGRPLIPDYPTAGVVNGAETLRLKFNLLNVRAPETGEAVIQVTAADARAEAEQPALEPAGANIIKIPDEQYVKSGLPVADVKDVVWNDPQNGLSLGYRITGDGWRVGGAVKVELWVRNAGEKDVKFQHIARTGIGLRVFLKGADGKEHEASIAEQFNGSPVFLRALPAGHIFKVKEFSAVLLAPGGKSNSPDPHFTLPVGGYKFRCEVSLPGITATDTDGKQVTPAEGEWTGTLRSGEFGVQLVAADAPKAESPKQGAAVPNAVQRGLSAEVKPERTRLSNDRYSAVAFQSEEDVNFVLIHQGALSTGLTESSSETLKRWSIEGNVHFVDREKTQAAGKNVDKRVVAVKYTSDEPNKLYLDGKAYDLAASPRLTPMGALEAAPGRIFLLLDEGEPFQAHRTHALRNEKDLATIGQFAVNDHFTAGIHAESRRVEQMDGWVLAWDFQVPHRRSGGHRTARLRIFPDGRVLSLPEGRTLHKLNISTEEVSELLRWLAEDQKVPAVKPQAAQPGDPRPQIAQEFDTWAGGMSFLRFIHNGKLHDLTVGSHLRPPGTGKELPNPGYAAFKAIGERLQELENKAVTAPVESGEDAADPAVKPPGANSVERPSDR